MPLSIVLVEPEIPWNTGNVARSCAAAGAALHLVGRLGFSLSERRIRRAGMDYWDRVKPVRHADWESFERALPAGASLLGFVAEAPLGLWDAPLSPDSYLVFGSESTGLPPALREKLAGRLVSIPMPGGGRSLNLSTAAGVALYEALRRAVAGRPSRA